MILWDGGNNDLPFYVPDLHICIADPHRPGHETAYHPGEANFRRADVILINKCDTADEGNIHAVEMAAAKLNPKARVLRARTRRSSASTPSSSAASGPSSSRTARP